MVMVVLAQFDGSRWVSVLLSADGDPNQLKNKMPNEPPDQKLAEAVQPKARPALRRRS